MNLRVYDDHESLSEAVAEEVVRRIERKERSAIALSGGSTPRAAYELLGRMPRRPRIADRQVLWTLTDERWVPPYDPDSNVRMVMETLFQLGVPAGHQFVRFRTDFDNPERSANEFEGELREAQGDEPLDLAILGVGEDGHTASLFPGTPVLDEETRFAAAVRVPHLDAWRLTLTLPVLRAARERLVLASGSSKRAILEEVRRGADLPVVRATADAETWWFVDREAHDPEEVLSRENASR